MPIRPDEMADQHLHRECFDAASHAVRLWPAPRIAAVKRPRRRAQVRDVRPAPSRVPSCQHSRRPPCRSPRTRAGSLAFPAPPLGPTDPDNQGPDSFPANPPGSAPTLFANEEKPIKSNTTILIALVPVQVNTFSKQANVTRPVRKGQVSLDNEGVVRRCGSERSVRG